MPKTTTTKKYIDLVRVVERTKLDGDLSYHVEICETSTGINQWVWLATLPDKDKAIKYAEQHQQRLARIVWP